MFWVDWIFLGMGYCRVSHYLMKVLKIQMIFRKANLQIKFRREMKPSAICRTTSL